jgi:hypothetical protein
LNATARRCGEQYFWEMERVVPWSALCGLTEPVYPKPGNGRRRVGVERMLRVAVERDRGFRRKMITQSRRT